MGAQNCRSEQCKSDLWNALCTQALHCKGTRQLRQTFFGRFWLTVQESAARPPHSRAFLINICRHMQWYVHTHTLSNRACLYALQAYTHPSAKTNSTPVATPCLDARNSCKQMRNSCGHDAAGKERLFEKDRMRALARASYTRSPFHLKTPACGKKALKATLSADIFTF